MLAGGITAGLRIAGAGVRSLTALDSIDPCNEIYDYFSCVQASDQE